MLAIAKPNFTTSNNNLWLIRFASKVGLFKIRKRVILFLNKTEAKSNLNIDMSVLISNPNLPVEIIDLVKAYNQTAFWEPLLNENYDSISFQCILELN